MARRILHIFLHPNPASERVERVLEQQGWDSHSAADCYAGLAQLVRRGAGFFECIVIRFNDLVSGEEEFFPMAMKLARGAPIYFYGEDTGGVSAETARLHGARGPIEVEALLQAFGEPGGTQAAPSAPPPADTHDVEPQADPGDETPPRLSDDELEALLGEDPP